MEINNSLVTFRNSHIRFIVTEPTHKDHPFAKGITESLAGGLIQQILIVKTVLKMLSKLQNYKV